MSGVSNSQSGELEKRCTTSEVKPCYAYEVQSLLFRYQSMESMSHKWILNDLSFQVDEREVLGIVGPNGSGKTSLLKLLARLASPQQGVVRLFGRDLTGMGQDEMARVVGVVPQESQQLFPFTVAETVLMGRFPHRSRDRWGTGFGWESGGCRHSRGRHDDHGRHPLGSAGGDGPFRRGAAADDDCASVGSDAQSLVAR